MDRKLLDILCCPSSHQGLSLLEPRALESLNQAIAAGAVKRADQSPQTDALGEALVTTDRKTVYRVEDGIPVLLAEEAIATHQVGDFPQR